MSKRTLKYFLYTASILGFLAVGIGAFGAHGLKNILAENNLPIERLKIYQTGVSYHFYHTLALFISLINPYSSPLNKKITGYFFVTGIFFFSGSLYLLSIRELILIPTYLLGPMTPIGGILFMFGWFTILLGIRHNFKNSDYDTGKV